MNTGEEGLQAAPFLSLPPDCCGAEPLFKISREDREEEAAYYHQYDEYDMELAEGAHTSYHQPTERSSERDSRTDYIINLVQAHKVVFQEPIFHGYTCSQSN